MGLVLAAPAAAQTLAPAEAYGRLPAVSDAAISPDGRRIALAESNEAGLAWVSVINLDNTSERTTYGLPNSTQLRAIGWVDDNFVSFYIDRAYRTEQIPLPGGMRWAGPSRRVDIFRWGVIDLRSGRPRMLYTDPDQEWADWGAALIAPIVGDDGFVRLIGGNTNWDRGNAAVYRVNIQNGRSNRITPVGTNNDTTSYALDAQGQIVARVDANRQTNRWEVFGYVGGVPRSLISGVSDRGGYATVTGLLPDGRLVVHLYSDSESNLSRLYAFDIASGEHTTLFARDGVDIDDAILDPWTRQVIGATWTGDDAERQYFDADLQRVYEAAAAALGGAVRMENWSRDRRRFIIYAERGLDGGGYYLFEPAANTMRRLAMRYPLLADRQDGERQAIRYRARDGVSIPAILTLPDGPRQNLPLILMPHGGPHGVRDDMSFDYWASFLASRGYAVLQPNYRGSGGYGDAWQSAGFRQWGGLMQRDIEDGVDALARAGIIDPQRVCIVGSSYGGYAALVGATMTPDRYRCAISVSGVSDLNLMLADTERRSGGDDSSPADWWRQSIGDRDQDREEVRGVSPVNLADAATAPVLLIHGTDDTVVPIEQSRRMQRALERAGKDVRFIQLRGDDHWLSDAPTRIQMLSEIEGFLGQHLPAQ